MTTITKNRLIENEEAFGTKPDRSTVFHAVLHVEMIHNKSVTRRNRKNLME